jgi:hypothetical protein
MSKLAAKSRKVKPRKRHVPAPAKEEIGSSYNTGSLLRRSDHSTSTQLDSRSLTPDTILRLQRTIGNQAVQRLLAAERQDAGATQQPRIVHKAGSPTLQRGLWSSIKKGVKKAGGWVKDTAKSVGSGVKKAAGWVKDAAKSVGGGIKKAAGWLKKAAGKVWTGLKWVGKQTWSKLKGVFHRVKRWIVKLPARLKRAVVHIWEGVKSLKPWSLEWWKSLGKASTWTGFLKWLGTLTVYGLEILGIGEIYETIMDFIKFNTRELSSGEKAKARSIFGGTIDYALVRVDDKAIIGPAFTKREYVSFHTINGWGGLDDHTLIHEMSHVWQYETAGAMYMPQAIHAQIEKGDKAYEYGDLDNLKKVKAKGQGMGAFNREAQAQIVADFYVKRQNGALSEADLRVYTHFVKEVSSHSEEALLKNK